MSSFKNDVWPFNVTRHKKFTCSQNVKFMDGVDWTNLWSNEASCNKGQLNHLLEDKKDGR
ncbi:hypothetical protein HanIR_Chr05g0219451 [Helianthus annuus]|nr:hypothetical protein HanIR_Chr05g0219451 [Helianthus annuus]